MPAALNLSNEVVKMRAEVKRVKVLIIRKLTRQIVALKRKKGSEADLERNRRRAARLLEEIHELKTLAPDSVTKAALQSDLSFEKVCQKKECSLAERATARIATHPEFSKRIRSIKIAIEAFKAERTSAEKKEKESRDTEQQGEESEPDSDPEEDEDDDDDDDDEDDDDGSSIKILKADEEQLRDPTKKNKDPVTAKESCSETGGTSAEVVRMRKEVKKLRVLILRNLTQQIAALKKAKADDAALKGNMECAARLQKEVHVLRTLLPDHVTIRALEGNIDMEKAFQDPESSALERATARIATHERFLKKLQDIRQAIEKETATKDGKENKDVSETMQAGEGDGETEDEDKDEEVAGADDDDDDDSDYEEKEEKKIKVQEKNPSLNMIPSSKFEKPPEDTSRLASLKEKPKRVELEKAASSPANPRSTFKPAVKAVQSLPSQSKEAPRPFKRVSKPDTTKTEGENDHAESDLSDSEEEKEYFDDSTEERFHKQSSYSEQSDDDDFFLGKVSRLKKKKSDTAPRPEKTNDASESREEEVKKTQEFKMESVFCSALSKSGTSSQRGKRGGPNAPPFRNQKRDEKPAWVKSHGSERERKFPGFKNQTPGSRGGDKPAFDRRNPPIHKAGKHFQQALHPSWEASRKRKEQQAHITAFQGKKIKFDDDDD